MRVTHTKTTPVVGLTDWNADHTIEGFVADDDSRLTDARTPTAHSHDYADPDHLHPHTHPENADSVHSHPYSDSGHTHDTTHSHTASDVGAAEDDHTHPGGAEAFPVGSVFLSVVSTSPATLLGYGTWLAIAAGRMLVGRDSGNAAFDTAEETGGSSTHTHAAHTGVVSHTHPITDPGHVHDEYRNSATTGGLDGWAAGDTSTNTPLITGYDTGSKVTGVTVNAPVGAVSELAHEASTSHLPPYFVVYAWKRTA
jgi:hypothetical protein